MSTAVLVVALVALFATFSMQLSPCTGTVQAAQCEVGDDETFTGPTTFEGEINVGATPGPGSTGSHVVSQGASTSPEWSLFARKTADETVNNSATLQDDDDLTFSVVASATYRVDGFLFIDGDTIADFKLQWSLPAGATFDGVLDNDVTGAGNARETFTEAASEDIQLDGVGNPVSAEFSGVLITSGTAGTAVVQWAQQSAQANDLDLKGGSWVELTRIN